MATEMSCTSCEELISPTDTSQVFRILPRNGMMAWVSRSRACLAEPPAESPSTRNSSECFGSWLVQSASLPGQRRTRGHALALDLLRRLGALLRVLDGELRDALAGIRMLVEPQRQRIVHEALDQRGGVARGEALLHLAGELRLLDLDRQHEAGLVEDVFGRELDAARHQVAELAELAHRARDAGAQAVHVRAAFGGGNEVDVALAHGAFGVRRPHQRVLDDVDLRAGRSSRRWARPAARLPCRSLPSDTRRDHR